MTTSCSHKITDQSNCNRQVHEALICFIMTNNSDDAIDGFMREDNSVVGNEDVINNDNASLVPEVSEAERNQEEEDQQLISFFEKHTTESIAEKNRSTNPLYSGCSNDIIEKSYQTVCARKVNLVKTDAARSTMEQVLDSGEMFKMLKGNTKKQKTTNLIPSHMHGRVKHLFHFKKTSSKRKSLMSFISDLPRVSLLCTNPNSILAGFAHNGLLDSEDNLSPILI